MADKTGRPSLVLREELLSRAHEFSFDQIMRLARVALGAEKIPQLPERPWQERLRFRPDLSLAFPAADVARVERSGEDDAELLVTTTFLGLYGSSSPLPNHYTEELLDEAAADSSVSRDFLDIIHQRLYRLYCRCWSKYRLFIRVAEEKNPRDRERLFCLIGLGQQELRDCLPDAWTLVRHAGVLSQFPRSAEGLRTLLRDALGIGKLEVEQCVLRQAPIPAGQQSCLGVCGVDLGTSSVLGSEMADRMGKFRIHVGPLSRDDSDRLLPGTPLHGKLARLVRLYISDPLDFELRLSSCAGDTPPLSLGAPDTARLGLNTWCFSGHTLGETSATFPLAAMVPPASAPSSAAGGIADDRSPAAEQSEPSSLTDYYREELARLRELAMGYAEAHPELASIVGGQLADPSVERLLEGVAFLNAHLLQKLDDDWPEIIDDLIDATQPNTLRPIPATTIIVFTPKPNCKGPQMIPVGTGLKSIPVDGTACRFTTRYPVEIHPLTITDASFSQPAGKPPTITLNLKLSGLRLEEWKLKSLRLFLAGEYRHAANLYLVLMRHLKRIVMTPLQEGQPVTLDATHLKSVGFAESEQLFPCEVPGAVAHQMMQEFSILPEKFLFLDLHGWERWRERGRGAEFEIGFELDRLPCELHKVSKMDFALFATPAINVFKHTAEPIAIAPPQLSYPVVPAGGNPSYFPIYSIERVTGIARKTNSRIPFSAVRLGHPEPNAASTYHVKRADAALHDEIHLSIASTTVPLAEISNLSLELACSNGALPERLQIGDVCHGTDDSPTFAGFSNCKRVTRSEIQGRGNNNLWRQFSDRSMNLSLLDTALLRALLNSLSRSSASWSTRGRGPNPADGITELRVLPVGTLIGGFVRQGWEITIKMKREWYRSPGDLYLFAAVLDSLLGDFASESSFTKIIVEDDQGESYQWPARKGRRTLL